jgi:hypothetical protein
MFLKVRLCPRGYPSQIHERFRWGNRDHRSGNRNRRGFLYGVSSVNEQSTGDRKTLPRPRVAFFLGAIGLAGMDSGTSATMPDLDFEWSTYRSGRMDLSKSASFAIGPLLPLCARSERRRGSENA